MESDSPTPDSGARPEDIDAEGVDRAQIRAMLALTPEERLMVAQEYADSVRAIREANRP